MDTHVYDTGIVLIVEVMGRNAGWLTAASTLGAPQGFGPDLIYLPEIPFDVDDFIEDVKNVAARKNNKVIAVISEGIKDQSGKYISEYLVSLKRDSFGHAQLGGTATVLAGIVADKFKIKVRPIEYSLLQRCSAHIASKTDIEEAFNVGAFAVKQAIQGETDKMVAIIRDYQADTYKVSYQLVDVAGSANLEKHVPIEWIKPDRSGMTQEFYDYVMPLIQGEANQPKENSLPRFAHLKKIYAKK